MAIAVRMPIKAVKKVDDIDKKNSEAILKEALKKPCNFIGKIKEYLNIREHLIIK